MEVRIKDWETMKKEYRIDSDGDIEFTYGNYFTKHLESYMPEDRIIDVKLGKIHSDVVLQWTKKTSIYLNAVEEIVSISKEEKEIINGFKDDVKKLFEDKMKKSYLKVIGLSVLCLAIGAISYKKVRG